MVAFLGSVIQSLRPGRYLLRFKIPPYRFSNGDYRISFSVGQRRARNYATENSDIYFSVIPDTSGFASAAFDNNIIKSSIIREDWFEEIINI